MRAKVTISDMKGSESRSKVFDFKDYDELNTLVEQFEDETNFRRLEVQIEAAGDDVLDEAAIAKIEEGSW